MKLKKCSRCGKEFPPQRFNKDKRNNDGLRYDCKACQYESQLKHLQKKVQELKENQDD